jgi:succinate dehydrogenase/fumarate reductase flavoprotein subunit
MGGVRASDQGEALDANGDILAGLFVAGQALRGLHGSNRLGSTSLAEGIIFGRRAGSCAASFSISNPLPAELDIKQQEQYFIDYYTRVVGSSAEHYPIHLIRKLQASCWQGIGPARTAAGIETTLLDLDAIEQQLQQPIIAEGLDWNQGLINYIECRNMLSCARQVAMSALKRKHSLGAHVRLDGTGVDRNQAFSVTCQLSSDEGIQVATLLRPSSPRSEKIRMALRQKTKKALIKLLNNMPHHWRDPLLVKIYLKAMGSARVQETTS